MVFKNNKCISINKNEYYEVLEISDNSTCLADCISKLQETFKLSYDKSYNLAQAVRNEYKYMKVLED